MKRVYKFIAGNSAVTPVGIALAVVAAITLGGSAVRWVPAVYVGILLLTLAASTFEKVQ